MKITKAKLTKENTVVMSYTETTADDVNVEVDNLKSDRIAHQDLRDAFEKLTIHLAFILNLPEVKGKKFEKVLNEPELLAGIKVTSWTIAGEGSHEGIVLTGQKVLEDGKVWSINTPFYKWEDTYKHIDDLGQLIAHCEAEVIEYYNGKEQPRRQLSFLDQLDLPEGVTVSVSTKGDDEFPY